MRTFTAGLLAVLLSAGCLAAQDEKKDSGKEKSAPAGDDLAAIQKDFEAAAKELVAAFRAAKTPTEREAVIDRLAVFGERAVKAAEKNPKSAEELHGWALENFAGMPGTEKVVGLLRGLSDKGATDTIRGRSTFALAEALARRSEKAADPKKGAADAKEAEALLERVVKEYAKVTDDGEPLGDSAKARLFELRNLAVGKVAPAAESKDLDGKAAKLADHKGKVVVLDFWATWCPPCRAMIPHERELVKRLKDKPFVLISVSADDEKKTLTEFIEKEPMPWVHWHDGAGAALLKGWSIRAFPTIYVIDPKGVIRYKFVGGVKEELDQAVEKLLKEAEDEKKS